MQMRQDDQEHEALHDSAVAALATEFDRPLSDVRRIYDSHFSTLKSNATVKDFLVVLTSRRAREELKS